MLQSKGMRSKRGSLRRTHIPRITYHYPQYIGVENHARYLEHTDRGTPKYHLSFEEEVGASTNK